MNYGWQLKTFKTREKMENFIKKNQNKIQWKEIFINNEYAIEYKKLLKIYQKVLTFNQKYDILYTYQQERWCCNVYSNSFGQKNSKDI